VTLAALEDARVAAKLRGPGLSVAVGPLSVRFRSTLDEVASYLRSHYAQFQVLDQEGCHLAVEVQPTSGVHRFVKRQAVFHGDGLTPFHPLPRPMAPALLEWGFNWCIGRRVHHLVVVHSAVIARGGRAALLPAQPEAGKSTLCAALVAHGWQLCSDEFTLIDPATSDIYPLPRPISLKERSIDIIASRMPGAVFSPDVISMDGRRTCHLAPPATSVARSSETVTASWIVVPKYAGGSPTEFEPVPRARMLAHLADSSYNYNALGVDGFKALARVVDGSSCHSLTYSNIDEALQLFDAL
jgi:HprK-related kinase A